MDFAWFSKWLWWLSGTACLARRPCRPVLAVPLELPLFKEAALFYCEIFYAPPDLFVLDSCFWAKICSRLSEFYV